MIHGGGFLGSGSQGDFCVHGYIPLAKSHMGVEDEAMIHWNTRRGVSSEPYDSYLLQYNVSACSSPLDTVNVTNVGAIALLLSVFSVPVELLLHAITYALQFVFKATAQRHPVL